MKLNKIPYDEGERRIIIYEPYNLSYINNLKVSTVHLNFLPNSEIMKCLCDHKYILNTSYIGNTDIENYYIGNNTISVYFLNQKNEYDKIIKLLNNKNINTLKIFFQNNCYNNKIKLLNNLPENIQILYLSYNLNNNLTEFNEITNLPITLQKINISIFNNYQNTIYSLLQNVINMKIPFNCSIDCEIKQNDSCFKPIIYRNLQKYK